MYILMSIGLWALEPFLLRYESRDTRRVDFPRVDGWSTDPRVLGRHILSLVKHVIIIQLHIIFSKTWNNQ